MVRSLELEDPKLFLGQVIEPPNSESVVSAVKHLRELRAFGAKAELTPLGYHLASMPVDAQIGKMLIYSNTALYGSSSHNSFCNVHTIAIFER